MAKTQNYPLSTGLRVLTSSGGDDPRLVMGATLVGKTSVLVHSLRGSDELVEKASDITVDQKTAKLEFTAHGIDFRVRSLREPDGLWLSAYKIDLPTDALRGLALEGEDVNPNENLVAYATEDSAYVVGLVYTNDVGRWVRSDGDWVMLSAGDSTFDGTNMTAIQIDPSKAAAFISQFDKNFVTVSDAEQYESAEPGYDEPESDSEPDNNSDE